MEVSHMPRPKGSRTSPRPQKQPLTLLRMLKSRPQGSRYRRNCIHHCQYRCIESRPENPRRQSWNLSTRKSLRNRSQEGQSWNQSSGIGKESQKLRICWKSCWHPVWRQMRSSQSWNKYFRAVWISRAAKYSSGSSHGFLINGNWCDSEWVELFYIKHKWLHFPHHGSKSRPEKFSIWASNFLETMEILCGLSNYSTIEIENYYISYEKSAKELTINWEINESPIL